MILEVWTQGSPQTNQKLLFGIPSSDEALSAETGQDFLKKYDSLKKTEDCPVSCRECLFPQFVLLYYEYYCICYTRLSSPHQWVHWAMGKQCDWPTRLGHGFATSRSAIKSQLFSTCRHSDDLLVHDMMYSCWLSITTADIINYYAGCNIFTVSNVITNTCLYITVCWSGTSFGMSLRFLVFAVMQISPLNLCTSVCCCRSSWSLQIGLRFYVRNCIPLS